MFTEKQKRTIRRIIWVLNICLLVAGCVLLFSAGIAFYSEAWIYILMMLFLAAGNFIVAACGFKLLKDINQKSPE